MRQWPQSHRLRMTQRRWTPTHCRWIPGRHGCCQRQQSQSHQPRRCRRCRSPDAARRQRQLYWTQTSPPHCRLCPDHSVRRPPSRCLTRQTLMTQQALTHCRYRQSCWSRCPAPHGRSRLMCHRCSSPAPGRCLSDQIQTSPQRRRPLQMSCCRRTYAPCRLTRQSCCRPSLTHPRPDRPHCCWMRRPTQPHHLLHQPTRMCCQPSPTHCRRRPHCQIPLTR